MLGVMSDEAQVMPDGNLHVRHSSCDDLAAASMRCM